MSSKPGCFLKQDNIAFRGSYGISENNARFEFIPAFQDAGDGRVEVSRFRDGRVAPFHILDGLPDEWVIERNTEGKVISVKSTIISGFVLKGRFFNREQAASYVERLSFQEG